MKAKLSSVRLLKSKIRHRVIIKHDNKKNRKSLIYDRNSLIVLDNSTIFLNKCLINLYDIDAGDFFVKSVIPSDKF